jgi:iron complex outermembrane receptor protein
MAVYAFAQNLQDSFVDLNSIPIAAIERIEVLKDGASAIYGSDAIAGVVNVILRKDYSGAEMTVGGGITTHEDGEELRISGVIGVGNPATDRYNYMLVADYFDRGHVWARDRVPSGDYRHIPGGANISNSTIANPGTYVRRPGTTPFPTARVPFPTCPQDRIVLLAGSPQCTENLNLYHTAIPETERTGLFGRASWELGGGLSAWTELAFNSVETFTQNPPFGAPSSQLGVGVARAVAIILPVGHNSNPYNVPVEVRYRFSDVGPRQIENTTDATRIVAGLNGGWRDWSWEVAAGYSRSETEQKDKNNIRISGLTSVIADNSYNFLDNSRNTPEVYDRLRVNYSRVGDSKQSFVDGKLSGELMQTGNGPVGMAAGMEYRKEDYNDVSDPVLVNGDVLGRGSTQAVGRRSITSAYVEFSVPAAKNLELQLAGRVDHYSDYGTSSTPKVGLRWTPSSAWLLRATYAQGFRAPSIPESGESSAFFFQNLQDTTRCAINSVYCGTVSLPGSFSANPDLKPEKSDSWTTGFVWEPVRNASIAMDYYYIKWKDIVSSRDFQFILDNENTYARYVTRGAPGAEDIARGAPGPVILVAVPYENLSKLTTDGIDLDARIRFPAGGWGAFTLGFTGSYILSYEQPLAPEEPPTELAGTYNLPRFKGVGTLTWDSGPWSTTLAVNCTDGFEQSTSAGAGADPKIKSWTTVDLQAAWTGMKNTKVTFGVKNIADEEPPVAIAETLLYTFQHHNLRGRFYYANLNYRFR